MRFLVTVMLMTMCLVSRADDPCPACGGKTIEVREIEGDCHTPIKIPIKKFWVKDVGGRMNYVFNIKIGRSLTQGFGLGKSECQTCK